MSRDGDPPQDPDVAIGAGFRARRLRFRRKPDTKVEYTGEARVSEQDGVKELEHDSGSHSERRNLPNEVEPGRTYRDVEVGWLAGARVKEPSEEADGAD